jgi:hypothetical protein
MLAVGYPRGVLTLDAGRRHNQRTRDWRVGHLIRVLADKAEAAGITVRLSMSGAPPPPAPAVPGGSRSPPDGTSAARTAGTRATAT